MSIEMTVSTFIYLFGNFGQTVDGTVVLKVFCLQLMQLSAKKRVRKVTIIHILYQMNMIHKT